MSLGDAAGSFLASLPAGEREISRQVVYGFVRWFGWKRPLVRLTAPEIANYAGRLSSSDTDHVKKLNLVRDFLAHARKAGWTKSNLTLHLKAKKGKGKATSRSRQVLPETIALTQHGYDEMKKELEALKSRRPQIIDEIHRAAADKDFKENAPLAAAREDLGYLEGRIKQLEEMQKSAVLIGDQPKLTHKASIGDGITLLDLVSGEELHYTIVSPREVNPAKGKISNASPIGKAIIGRAQGDSIEIKVPAGRLRYKIKQVGAGQT
jgi:transcription elongation factor GreA